MNQFSIASAAVPTAHAAPCLTVTLTGTGPGPAAFHGLAGSGTLVRYGDDGNDCGAVKLQFDAGRGTTMRLSQLGVEPAQLHGIFFTHMHNDHTEGFADLVTLRWFYHGTGPKLDAVGSADIVSPRGFTVSCRQFLTHIADAFIQSGEIAQRHSEDEDAHGRRPGRFGQYNHLRADRRAPSRLVLRRGEGERHPVDTHGRPCVLSRGHARR